MKLLGLVCLFLIGYHSVVVAAAAPSALQFALSLDTIPVDPDDRGKLSTYLTFEETNAAKQKNDKVDTAYATAKSGLGSSFVSAFRGLLQDVPNEIIASELKKKMELQKYAFGKFTQEIQPDFQILKNSETTIKQVEDGTFSLALVNGDALKKMAPEDRKKIGELATVRRGDQPDRQFVLVSRKGMELSKTGDLSDPKFQEQLRGKRLAIPTGVYPDVIDHLRKSVPRSQSFFRPTDAKKSYAYNEALDEVSRESRELDYAVMDKRQWEAYKAREYNRERVSLLQPLAQGKNFVLIGRKGGKIVPGVDLQDRKVIDLLKGSRLALVSQDVRRVLDGVDAADEFLRVVKKGGLGRKDFRTPSADQKLDVEDSLDGLVDDNGVDVVLMESLQYEGYKRRKPGRANGLVATTVSEKVAPATVIYNKDKMSKAQVEALRRSLLDLHKGIHGQQLMTLGFLGGIKALQFDPPGGAHSETHGDAETEAVSSRRPVAKTRYYMPPGNYQSTDGVIRYYPDGYYFYQ